MKMYLQNFGILPATRIVLLFLVITSIYPFGKVYGNLLFEYIRHARVAEENRTATGLPLCLLDTTILSFLFKSACKNLIVPA